MRDGMKDEMARIAPLRRDETKDFETLFEVTEAVMGFVPNSMLIMARDPDLLAAFAQLSANRRRTAGPDRSRLESPRHVRSESVGWLPVLRCAFGAPRSVARHSNSQSATGVAVRDQFGI